MQFTLDRDNVVCALDRFCGSARTCVRSSTQQHKHAKTHLVNDLVAIDKDAILSRIRGDLANALHEIDGRFPHALFGPLPRALLSIEGWNGLVLLLQCRSSSSLALFAVADETAADAAKWFSLLVIARTTTATTVAATGVNNDSSRTTTRLWGVDSLDVVHGHGRVRAIRSHALGLQKSCRRPVRSIFNCA